jgi:hypothetical protein
MADLEHVDTLRDEAKDDRKAKRFESAINKLRTAIEDLEDMLNTAREEHSAADISKVLEVLSQTHGSPGGTWRDAAGFAKDSGALEQAEEAFANAEKSYVDGNSYEEERRRDWGAKDSYNLLQQHVVRLLRKPSLINNAEFAAKLEGVRDIIQKQFEDGRDDSWGLADLALVQILCSADAGRVVEELEQRRLELEERHRDVIADLDKRQAQKSFYESTCAVVTALLKEGLDQRELAVRLEEFKRLLQRKGGLKMEQ